MADVIIPLEYNLRCPLCSQPLKANPGARRIRSRKTRETPRRAIRSRLYTHLRDVHYELTSRERSLLCDEAVEELE